MNTMRGLAWRGNGADGIGLIGLGRHGIRYVRHLSEASPDARLVAVCRRDIEQGRAVASQQGVKCFQDYEALIADPLVGAVVVAHVRGDLPRAPLPAPTCGTSFLTPGYWTPEKKEGKLQFRMAVKNFTFPLILNFLHTLHRNTPTNSVVAAHITRH